MMPIIEEYIKGSDIASSSVDFASMVDVISKAAIRELWERAKPLKDDEKCKKDQHPKFLTIWDIYDEDRDA